MALSDTLLGFTKASPAPKNRVEILLDTLEGDDLETLRSALRNPSVNGSALTKALRKEYGSGAVTDHSVGEWRRRNSAELTGL